MADNDRNNSTNQLLNEPEAKNSHARVGWIVGAIVIVLMVVIALAKPHSNSTESDRPVNPTNSR